MGFHRIVFQVTGWCIVSCVDHVNEIQQTYFFTGSVAIIIVTADVVAGQELKRQTVANSPYIYQQT
jgi:hypothetical protein